MISGGRVAEATDFMPAPAQQDINTFGNDTAIEFSQSGSMAGTMGAAAYVLEKITLSKK